MANRMLFSELRAVLMCTIALNLAQNILKVQSFFCTCWGCLISFNIDNKTQPALYGFQLYDFYEKISNDVDIRGLKVIVSEFSIFL